MAEYIERKAVINDIGELFTLCNETLPNAEGHHFIVESELQTHLDHVKSLPAADVVEVRRGQWIYEPGHIPHCSECGRYSDDADTGEAVCCPFCGAKMDRGQDE